jgi:uncharacterized lipoprotein YddW (UPF0748 family)
MKRFLGLGLVLCLPVLAAPPADEVRGLWVVRTGLLTPDGIDRIVEQAHRAGLNALFVQVRGRGDALYRSRLVPRSPLLADQAADFDPLGRLVRQAHARGLEVHAWFNLLLSANFGQPLPPGHLVRENPGWLMVPRPLARVALRSPGPGLIETLRRQADRTDVEGLYVSPSAPGLAEHLESVVGELLSGYAVDGLHLDFVRYPNPDYDWSPAALTAFQAGTGDRGDLLAAPGRDPEGWSLHRREALTRLVERLSRSARAARPGLVVTAAVVPEEALAVGQRFQDWPAWAAQGHLDALCPMTYTTDQRQFGRQVDQARRRSGAVPIWAGIGAWRLSAAEVVDRIRLARDRGAAGVVIFSHESLRPVDFDRLREEAFGAAVAAGPPPPSILGSAASGMR